MFIFSLGSLIPLKYSILIARPDVYNRSLLVVLCSCFNLKPPFPTRYKSRSGAYTKYLLLIRWIVYPVCCRFCILLLFFFFIIIFACFRLFFVRGCIFVCSSYCSKILQTLTNTALIPQYELLVLSLYRKCALYCKFYVYFIFGINIFVVSCIKH